ncbi:S-adenosyl-L-methionine-dependent methyltransferase [Ochromonadaceae sp. CCMP2298]|nr:S-adenosyl-L-methionine-dependent methyltransferase [Ochromonadaceae sp. CCMP2298]
MSEFANGEAALDDASSIMKGTEADKAADFANYFCSYSYLYHQKQMLMDHVRMRAYHGAIMQNKALFEGKVVLDVGTGSGVLSLWAAQAGAAKVYAVEYTDMAIHARNLVEKNGMSGVIEVIQSSVEDLQLPCKVDIIVSEWMGYILLRESMLDSVIRARDKWMKPGGSMFPSHATLYMSAISFEDDREQKRSEYAQSMSEWTKFSNEMKNFYNIDMGALDTPFKKEQADYYIYSSLWTELRIEHVIGQPVVIKQLDLNTCSLADSEKVDEIPYDITIPFPITVSGYASWFTVNFNGSVENPAQKRVTLSTGPEMGYTHWGQQVFYLPEAVDCSTDTKLHGKVSMTRQEKNKRLYNFNIEHSVDGDEDSKPVKAVYEIP